MISPSESILLFLRLQLPIHMNYRIHTATAHTLPNRFARSLTLPHSSLARAHYRAPPSEHSF